MANCNTQQLNITCGTDVVLHDRLIFDGETFDPNLSVGIAANLVSSLGKRTALDVQVVDDELLISVPWIDGTLPGCYGLEVTGSCNSKKWATYADSLIKYTKATRVGVSEVTVESDSYDITQEVGFRYGEGGNVNDVKVNGVSVVSAGKANITIPSNVGAFENDKNYQTGQQVAKSIQDNLVPNAVVTVDDNTGTPSATVTKSGNTLNFDFKNLKGKPFTYDDFTPEQLEALKVKGDQGDSAVYNPDDPDTPDFVMANTTGQSTTKAMSQKAVTDAISVKFADMSDLRFEVYWYIDSQGNFHPTTATTYASRAYITQYRGKTIMITANSNYAAEIAFLKSFPSSSGGSASSHYCDGTTLVTIPIGELYTAKVPDDCVGLYMMNKVSGNDYKPVDISILDFITDIIQALPQEIAEQTSEQIADEMKVILTEISNYPSAWWWYIDSNKWKPTTGNNYATILTDFSTYKGKQITVHAGSNGTAQIAFLKRLPTSSGSDVTEYCENTTLISVAANTVYNTVIPSDCTNFYMRHMHTGTNVMPTKIVISDSMENMVDELEGKIGAKPIIYVSASGNDDNAGTIDMPMQTIAAALNAGAADMTVVLLTDTHETINFAAWNGKKSHVTLRGGNKNNQARIIVGQPLELEEYESNADVYVCTLGENETLPVQNYTWLWQHGIEDTNTLISADERHPLQRGRAYRRLSTRITSVSSLSALLGSSSPCWFLDGRTLYVRTVTGSDISNNPIYYPRQEATAIKTGDFELTLCNIEAWYGKIIVGATAASANNMGMMFKAYDCAARYTWAAGAWRLDDAISSMLIRCEADSNQFGTTGDGFNLHPSAVDNYPYGKGCSHTLVDCWAHDMKDDGYSDHGRSEGTIIGGLFEHNGKGGVLPSYGSHDTLYGVTARRNWAGIYCAGEANDGGMGTQVECNGCVCLENTYNYSCLGVDSGDEQVNLVLNGCISRNAFTAAVYANKNCVVVLRDCTDSGSPTVKSTSSGATITIDNGTTIS